MMTAAFFLIIVSLSALLYPYWKKRRQIKQWYHSLDLHKHHASYLALFQGIDGFALSTLARKSGDAIEYTYGEIELIPFVALLSLARPDNKTVFYDLGSGVGKAVLACAMVFNVKKSCGVEIFEILHREALACQERLQQRPDYKDLVNKIFFMNANFLSVDFSDATLIFINATAFFGETWRAIYQSLYQVKPGSMIITTSKQLPVEMALLLKTTQVQMSWGPVKAYIHQRI